jgi:Mg2+/Co2+ transporter CorC
MNEAIEGSLFSYNSGWRAVKIRARCITLPHRKKEGNMAGIFTRGELDKIIRSADLTEEQIEEIAALEDGRFRIRGTAVIGDVEEALGIELSDDDFDTFGGLVFAALGQIPRTAHPVT